MFRPLICLFALALPWLPGCPGKDAPPGRTAPGNTAGIAPDHQRPSPPGARRRAWAGPVRALVEAEGNRFGVGLCVVRTRSARCGAVVSADPSHPPTFKVIPRPVKRISGVRALAPGGDHHCELRTDRSVWCRGSNSRGQLGLGHLRSHRRLARIPWLKGVVSLTTSWRTSCVARSDGSAWCWGEAAHGQAGDGGRICTEDDDRCAASRLHRSPHRVAGLGNVSRVFAAYGFACALKKDATLWCWGENDAGQLGDGTRRATSTPRRVRGLSGVRQVALSTNQSCAVTTSGALWCWPGPGKGRRRRLGPRRIPGLTGVTAVATGTDHVCAIAAGGQVWCWGKNGQGQLGDGTHKDRPLPVRAKGLTGVQVLLGLTASTCAARADGTLWCWGAMGLRSGQKRQQIPLPRRVRLIGK